MTGEHIADQGQETDEGAVAPQSESRSPASAEADLSPPVSGAPEWYLDAQREIVELEEVAVANPVPRNLQPWGQLHLFKSAPDGSGALTVMQPHLARPTHSEKLQREGIDASAAASTAVLEVEPPDTKEVAPSLLAAGFASAGRDW